MSRIFVNHGCKYRCTKRDRYNGKVKVWCGHEKRAELRGFWGRILKTDFCIMTQYDEEDYCPLFENRYRMQEEIIKEKIAKIKQLGKGAIKMKPLWAVLAQSIGKELNESFIWENGIYKISEDGLSFWEETGMEWMKSSMGMVMKFLDGIGDIGIVGDECHRCGTNIKDLPNDIKFCPYCGTKTIGRTE